MNCAWCRLLLEDRLDGLLDAEREAGVAGHLEGCEACAREWRELEALERLLRASANAPATPPARETLERLVPFRPAPPAAPRRWIAAAAVLLAALAFCENLGDDAVSRKSKYTKHDAPAGKPVEDLKVDMEARQAEMSRLDEAERLRKEARRVADAVRAAEEARRREERLKEEARLRAEWTPRLRACAAAQGQQRAKLVAELRGQRAAWEVYYLGILRDAADTLDAGLIGLAADVELSSTRPPLRRLLEQPRHRLAAWRTLARMKDPAALATAAAALRAGKDRDLALSVIAELAPESAVPILVEESRSERRRALALRLLAGLGGRVDAELAARLASRDRKTQRETLDLAVALRRLPLARPIQVLTAIPALRGDAIRALLALRDPESVPFLLDAMGDPELAGTIAAGLPAFGEPGKTRLRALLSSGAPTLRARAARMLAAAGDPAARPALCALLPDARVRREAIVALGLLGDRGAIACLAPYVDDPLLADAAIEAIATLGGEAALPPLVMAASRRATQRDALAALGRLRARAALPLVLAGLADPRVAAVAAKSLAEIGDPRAVPALIVALSRAEVRTDALAALRSLTAQDLPADPAAWLGWWKTKGKGSRLDPDGSEVKAG